MIFPGTDVLAPALQGTIYEAWQDGAWFNVTVKNFSSMLHQIGSLSCPNDKFFLINHQDGIGSFGKA
jgi:hypothetical protein